MDGILMGILFWLPVIVFVTSPIMWTRLSPTATFDTDGTLSSSIPIECPPPPSS
jgi:hypothetical protein